MPCCEVCAKAGTTASTNRAQASARAALKVSLIDTPALEVTTAQCNPSCQLSVGSCQSKPRGDAYRSTRPQRGRQMVAPGVQPGVRASLLGFRAPFGAMERDAPS